MPQDTAVGAEQRGHANRRLPEIAPLLHGRGGNQRMGVDRRQRLNGELRVRVYAVTDMNVRLHNCTTHLTDQTTVKRPPDPCHTLLVYPNQRF